MARVSGGFRKLRAEKNWLSSRTNSGTGFPATRGSCAMARKSPPCAPTPLSFARIADEHGGFGQFLSQWPRDDEIGLLDFLSRNGTRLGGMTGQYFLRHIGWDAFILSRDVIACLRDAGVEISEKSDIQARSGGGAGGIFRLGAANGPRLHASVAHLRHVGRRESRRGNNSPGAWAERRNRRLNRCLASSFFHQRPLAGP